MTTKTTTTEVPKAEEGFSASEAVTTIVHFTDGLKERQAFYLKLLKSSLDDETLSDLRSNIAGLTGSIEISHFPFCGKQGAVVPDSFSVQEYLTECLGIKTAEAKTLEIYMRDGSTSEQLNAAKANVGDVLGIDKVAYLKNQVGDVAFKWITGTQAKYVPELEQRDWAAISDSNALCYGIRVIRVKDATEASTTSENSTTTDKDKDKSDSRGTPIGIERARSPAFRLKKRTIWSDNIPSSTIDGVKLDLRIPDFIIDDKSYVSIYETETEMQSSMATSSFSETDVAAAGSGSYMGFSGSASMSFALASSQAATSTKSKKSKKVTLAYNFPRVTVFLDSRSLELTPECSDALLKIKSKEDLYEFQDIYGEFFSTRVQLGGRLFATEDVTGSSATSSSEKANSMKLAASASFSGWGASASVSASHASGGDKQEGQASKESVSSLTWQANGGDTLLCNQPLEWAPTVSYHWNWRSTKQDHIVGILDVASQLKGMNWLVKVAQTWGVTVSPKLDTAIVRPPPVPAVVAKTFTLHAAGVTGGRYLLTCTPTARNISATAQARNSAGKNSFSINSGMHNKGCVLLGPEKAESLENLRLYEAEDASGKLVTEIKYNTKYRVKNKERGVYIDYHFNQGARFMFGNPQRSNTFFIAFKDPKGSVETNAIPDGSTLHVRFYEYQNDDKLGYMYTCAKDKKYAYLFASKPGVEDGDETELVITYK